MTYNSDLLCMCCELLHNVCEVAVQHCPTVSVWVRALYALSDMFIYVNLEMYVYVCVCARV